MIASCQILLYSSFFRSHEHAIISIAVHGASSVCFCSLLSIFYEGVWIEWHVTIVHQFFPTDVLNLLYQFLCKSLEFIMFKLITTMKNGSER